MVIPLCVGILEGFLQAIWEVLGANTISYKMFMAQFLGPIGFLWTPYQLTTTYRLPAKTQLFFHLIWPDHHFRKKCSK